MQARLCENALALGVDAVSVSGTRWLTVEEDSERDGGPDDETGPR